MCVLVVVISVQLIRLEASSEAFEDTNYTQDLVISRYNENLEWLTRIDLSKFNRVIVYNKGPFEISVKGVTIVVLPNVGRCDHTYLYHLVHHYDDLADVTIFLPASCDMDNKWDQTEKTISMASTTQRSAFCCSLSAIPRDVFDFSLDNWKASNVENASYNPEEELLHCPERPFGQWYMKNFGDLTVDAIVYLGIFAVSKAHAHHRSRDFYESIAKYVDHSSNPEAGHFIERSWLALFHPIPSNCMYF